jgi:hypothetical protein
MPQLAARAVLADCEEALEELKGARQDTLRRRWLTVMALLRAVGHVLDKVDGSGTTATPALRTAISRSYAALKASRPNPVIFWGFIEGERNNVLKAYEFTVRGNLTIPVPASSDIPHGLENPILMPPGSRGIAFGALGATHTPESRFSVWPLIGGPFEGQEPFKVVQQAIDFWRLYLDEVERAVS